MKDSGDHIEKIEQLTPELMQRYAKGMLSAQEQRAVELYLLDHPFEAEAMEGLIHTDDFQAEVDKLSKVLDKKTKDEQPKVIPLWRQPLKIAAAIALLIVGSFVIINSIDWFEKENTELALNETKETKEIEEDSKEPTETYAKKDERVADKKEQPVQEQTIVVEEAMPEKTENKPTPKPVLKPNKEVIEETTESDVQEEDIDKGEMVVADTYAEAELADESLAFNAIETERTDEAASGAVAQEAKLAEDNEIVAEEVEMARNKMKSSSRLSAKKDNSPIEQTQNKRSVQGRITSLEDGSGLPGVNVVVKGTTQGTITDLDGDYELELPSENAEIVISFIGYASEEIEVGDREVVDIALGSDVKQLSEVVVSAQGVEQKEPLPSQNAIPRDGYSSFKQYLSDNLRYPERARDSLIEGKVTVEFYVEENGALTDFRVAKSLGYGCDEEAVRLIKEGPAWEPAKNEGEPYRRKVRVKVKFEL